MSDESITASDLGRRSFLKGGAIIAAPLAVAGAPALAAGDDRLARLARLEDESAIRALHRSLVGHINGGTPEAAAKLFATPRAAALDGAIRAITADHGGEADAIAIAADGRSASGRFACLVETGAMLPMDNTLAQMAHAQGTGYISETRRAVMTAGFIRTEQGWAIARLEVAPV